MKKFILVSLLIISINPDGFCGEKLSDKIVFASVEQGAVLLTQEDQYTNSWSQFDINSRMRKPNSTKRELLKHIGEQVRPWTEDEKEPIRSVFNEIEEEIKKQGLKIDFPNEIILVKTTGNVEPGTAYTRSNYIVFNEKQKPTDDLSLKKLVIHELFHVLSRANSDFRKEMYGTIGFKSMNKVDYPEKIKSLRMTNPDAPRTESYISLTHKNEPVDCMMILYSNKAYDGGNFFDYLNIGLLKLKGEKVKEPALKNSQPVIYHLNEVSDFFKHVGKNTDYVIHPEEIMAENFTFVLMNKTDLPNSKILDDIRRILQK